MVRGVVVVCIVLLGVCSLFARQLPVRNYTTADGLASNSIYQIVQEPRGFLWFGTSEGLSRFDGRQFTSFGVEQGLPDRKVTAILITRGGDYWIATLKGVCRLNGLAPRAGCELHRLDADDLVVGVLADDGGGGVWCGTANGLYRIEHLGPNRWNVRRVNIGAPRRTGLNMITSIAAGPAGTLWIGAGTGLYRRFPDGRAERYTARDGLPHDHITELRFDSQGRLWVGTWAGLCRLAFHPGTNKPSAQKVRPAKGVPDSPVWAIFQSADGRLWIGTSHGLSHADPNAEIGQLEQQEVEGLPTVPMDGIEEDRAGNVWISASDRGAYRIAQDGFISYNEKDGLASNFVVSIFEDQIGELCVLSKSAAGVSINQFDGRRFHPVRPNVPPQLKDWGWGAAQLDFQDSAGEWWVATGEGMYRFPRVSKVSELERVAPKTSYGPGNGLAGISVHRAFEDHRGDIWISTDGAANGLTRLERKTGKLQRYGEAENMPPRFLVTAFAEDRSGNLWIASAGRLTRYRDGQFQAFAASAGLRAGWITDLYVDHAGRLWAASESGVVRIDSPGTAQPGFVTYSRSQGLAAVGASSIVEDRWGRLYVAGARGIDCFYPPSLLTGPLRVKHYTAADGLGLGTAEAAFRDRNGTLWFGTHDGVARLDPEPDRPVEAPPIRISGIRIRGESRFVSPLGESALIGLELRPNEDQIQIDFAGLDFTPRWNLQYQYRLEPGDRDWNPTESRTVNYARLSPGAYRFLVRAINADGAASPAEASVSFTLLPPLYQRWWFRLLALALAVGGLYSLYRYRVGRLLEVEKLRTQIATDLHDDVGSTAAQISILSAVAGRGAGPGQAAPLSEIAALSRDLAGSMRDIVWAIDPDQDRMGDLVYRMRRFSSDVFAHNGIRYEFHAPVGGDDLPLDADLRRQTFLIFKESLHNMVRHSGCTEARIHLGLQRGWLVLALHDNGRGFDPAHLDAGQGLRSMRERSQRLGGELAVHSAIGRGTSIVLRFPLSGPRPRIARSLHERIGAIARPWRMLKADGRFERH
jgi:ligand-binding sensor domain-containing protein